MPFINSHEDQLNILVFEYGLGTILCLELKNVRHIV